MAGDGFWYLRFDFHFYFLPSAERARVRNGSEMPANEEIETFAVQSIPHRMMEFRVSALCVRRSEKESKTETRSVSSP